MRQLAPEDAQGWSLRARLASVVVVPYAVLSVALLAGVLWQADGGVAEIVVTLGGGGAALAVAAAGAWIVGERAVRPIRELAAAARRVADGELEVGSLGIDLARRTQSASELADLTRAMSQMALQLRRRLAEVELEKTRARAAEQRAQDASRAKSVFLANMSHELRTPLNAVIGYAEMLLDVIAEDGHPEYGDDLGRIQRSGTHLLGLIDDLLDLARIEAGRMELSIQTVDVSSLVTELIQLAEPGVAQRRNRLEVELDPAAGTLRTDPVRLRQVLANLLGNAAKFTEDGVVTLKIERREEAMLFEVRDTGIGIPMAQIEQLFQAFHQADASATRKYGGTGLGLALARRFSEMLGGGIEVESVPGQGSRFSLTLATHGPPGSWDPTWDPLAGIRTTRREPALPAPRP